MIEHEVSEGQAEPNGGGGQDPNNQFGAGNKYSVYDYADLIGK